MEPSVNSHPLFSTVAGKFPEKEDDISHLMTDTLAGIYLEQRLYTKATAAYQVLMEKYPEKIDFYKEKLEEIQRIKFPK